MRPAGRRRGGIRLDEEEKAREEAERLAQIAAELAPIIGPEGERTLAAPDDGELTIAPEKEDTDPLAPMPFGTEPEEPRIPGPEPGSRLYKGPPQVAQPVSISLNEA